MRQALEGADIVPLTMSLIQLTGDLTLLDAVRPYVRGPWDYSHSVPNDLAAAIRSRLDAELDRIAAGGIPALAAPAPEQIRAMMSAAVGEEVPAEYVPMLLQQMGLESGALAEPEALPEPEVPVDAGRFRIVIVGAGVSGIAAAIRLRQAGIPFVVIEKNPEVGGTWYENRYPGCAVDTPNHFYQFSFEPNNDWPRYYSHRESIWDYLNRCTDKYGIRECIRFGFEVVSAHFDEASHRWRVTCRDEAGRETIEVANALICAVGQLNRPAIPAIPGLPDFEGETCHTATWTEGTDLAGKRVALVGTGASGVQIGPRIAGEAASLHVLQRSGAWIVRSPNIHREVSPDKTWALDVIPFYAAWYRFQLFWGFADGLFQALRIDPAWQGAPNSISALNERYRTRMLRYIERELEGRPDLLAKAVPDYPPFGKRVLADPGWFSMLRRDNVSLETAGIARVEPEGIRLADGRLIAVDAIVFATGFQAGRMLWPMDIRGRFGRSIREAWGDDDPRAYLGITVPGFPNMFVMYGPNTNLGHGGSAMFLAECQVRYTLSCLTAMIAQGWSEIECRPDVHDAYNRKVDDELSTLVWTHPSVNSWYKNAKGRITTNQPWRLVDYWRMTKNVDFSDYHTMAG
ncbi:NAD(P)/FAD-dependent oxidoreductase [uncultured Methylobacterium sp.]|uniref:NAD(P)/FAD-dependent oxidoreductase n=1 Tax=uncultured Methylobacterium sp. TaxID=157278 RepID=UPI0025913A21|nr:NAD(P)/FAD-dependent oxidoreductase [uncultured Methylobacterium sp.]